MPEKKEDENMRWIILVGLLTFLTYAEELPAEKEYQTTVDRAKQDYDARVGVIKKEYDGKVKVAKEKLVAALEITKIEATKQGDLNKAVYLRDKIASLRADLISDAFFGKWYTAKGGPWEIANEHNKWVLREFRATGMIESTNSGLINDNLVIFQMGQDAVTVELRGTEPHLAFYPDAVKDGVLKIEVPRVAAQILGKAERQIGQVSIIQVSLDRLQGNWEFINPEQKFHGKRSIINDKCIGQGGTGMIKILNSKTFSIVYDNGYSDIFIIEDNLDLIKGKYNKDNSVIFMKRIR
jgi:hypothetical protein